MPSFLVGFGFRAARRALGFVSLLLAATGAGAAEPVDALLARDDLAAFRGWLKFLRFEADAAATRHGATSPLVAEKRARLDEWVRRIADDPGVLGKLRGVQEWAYESPVDGSGQPFRLNIPTDYDPARPAALTVVIHGYSGNHLEHSGGMAPRPGAFELAVLGRARGGWYAGLSQADVLHALDYVAAHWRIDPDRVRLAGGSMGGAATFRLGARFPHRFAAGQVTCGYLQQEPIANLLTFPIYATHSDDDPVVTILQSRGPLAELRRLGGAAIFDETDGLGHAAWNYAAGNARSAAWAATQVRPPSREVKRLDFTALDGGAARAWWAEIDEWGPAAQPARFRLTAAADNLLFVELANVARLRLRLDESPFDRARPLRVVVHGAVPRELPAPLPATVVLDADGAPAAEVSPPFRRHTPGGPLLVYDGSPLLIVYGTGGGEIARTNLRAAAEAARKSPNPAWAGDGGERGPADGVPHHQLLYGWLPVRADRDVTDAELAGANLVLIGTAAENSVVARLADRLPVRFAADTITCTDGVAWPAADRMLGLLHFNPLAPSRLLFWIAASDPAAYRADATLPQLAAGFQEGPVDATPMFVAADLVITRATEPTLVTTRRFDTAWRWTAGRESSPHLPEDLADAPRLNAALAHAVRRAAAAEFAVVMPFPTLGPRPVVPGETRVADLARLTYAHPIDVFELGGEALLALHARLARQGTAHLYPDLRHTAVEPGRTYRVAVPLSAVGPFALAALPSPRRQARATATVDEAIERFLLER